MGLFSSSGADLEIIVKLAVDEAIRKSKELEDSIKRTGEAAQRSESSFSGFSSNVTASALGAISLGSALAIVTKGLTDALVVERLTSGFETLQNKIGNNAVSAMSSLKDATKGLITELDLMKSANQAVLLGVDDGSGKFDDLANAALRLGNAMGIEAKEALDSLVIGIGRGSKQVLDNLGVVINAEEAYQKYATTLRITADKLSEVQKQEAIKAVATDAVMKSAEGLSDVNNTAAESYQKLKVALSDSYHEMVLGLSGSDSLKQSLDFLTEVVKGLPPVFDEATESLGSFVDLLMSAATEFLDRGATKFENIALKIADFIIQVISAKNEIASFASEIGGNLLIAMQKLNIALYSSAFGKFAFGIENAQKGIAKASQSIDELNTQIMTNRGEVLRLDPHISKLSTSFQSTEKQVDKTTESVEELEKELRLSKPEWKFVSDATLKANKNFDGLKLSTDKATESSKKHGVVITDTGKALYKMIDIGKELGNNVLKNQLKKDIEFSTEAFANQAIDIKTLTIDLEELRNSYIKLGLTAKEIDSLISSASLSPNSKIEKAKETVEGFFDKDLPDFLSKSITESIIDGFENGFNSDTIKSVSNSASQIFATKFQDSFGALFKKGGFTSANIGSALADLGLAYGISSLGQNLSDNKKDTKGGIVSGAITGASYGASFGAWGAIIGAVLGAGAGYLAGTTGQSNEKGARSRKETINFIEDAINRKYLPFLEEQGNIILGSSRRWSDDYSDGWANQFQQNMGQSINNVVSGIFGDTVGGWQADIDAAINGERYDPVPGQIQGSDWADQYWNTFGQEAGLSFSALGAAMTQFADESTEQFSQIGLVLAENLVGNLDNARLLLQTMGVSAQDLEQAFLEIGLSGQETWHTVETFFQQIPSLTGEGLVGLGDVKGALDQITMSGGRGQTALFGLRNLAIEIGEVGGRSLDDLKNSLLGAGLTAEETNSILQALQQRGIDNLEELRNASDRTLGGVIADMESLGYSFEDAFGEGLEESIQDIDRLRETITQIPDTVEKNLRINVSTKYQDAQSQQALNQISADNPGIARA